MDLALPASFALSLAQELNSQFTLLADITWTDWSTFQELRVIYDTPSPPTTVIPERWDDTFRYSVGGRYALNDTFVLRAGLVHDEAAVDDPEYVSPRIPETTRTWVTVGGQWRVSDQFSIDAAYARVMGQDGSIDNSSHSAGQILRGDTKGSAHIISVGGSYRF